jgi:lactate dehydrogenase-like 2-hydroxyacid dehydrogenase
MRKVAILDDYFGVALEFGDWSALAGAAEITVFREAIAPERLVAELFDYEIVVITQQRVRLPRAVLECLPNLRLIVCNGRTSNVIDHAARIERGILLCGTADADDPTAGHKFGLGAYNRYPIPAPGRSSSRSPNGQALRIG